MHLLYLDASGTPEVSDSNSGHYVLAGLCMKDAHWFGLHKRLGALKSLYQFGSEPFELHVSQFATWIREQDAITDFDSLSWTARRAKVLEIRAEKLSGITDKRQRSEKKLQFKRTNPFIHLTRRERSQLLEDAIGLIATHSGIRLFAEAISKTHPLILDGTNDPSLQAFEQVVSRFDKLLQKIDRAKLQSSRRPPIDLGLLILDRDPSTESRIYKLFDYFRGKGHSFGPMSRVIDVPFFASSENVSGLQIADVCAYVIRRYLDTGASSGSHEERQFKSLFPKFDRDKSGHLHGIRHYVASGTCNCLVCQERGHSATV